jgi:hypothetical protein
MLSASFRDCITICQGIPNILWLNLKDSSNSFDGEFSSMCVLCKGIEIEDLVSAEVGIDKIAIES